MIDPLRLAAPAKLNLELHVTGRRQDGYHELESLLVLLELADELTLLPGGSGLRVDAPEGEPVPVSPPRNLAWRGLLAGLGSEPVGECLTLRKWIPAQAGLGGGSSDAAAAWRLGRRRTGAGERPSARDVQQLVAIGADVPFFAASLAVARVRGIGEVVEPASLPSGAGDEVVLVHPPFRLSTAAVFGALRPGERDAAGRNDLFAPALRLRPELDDLVRLVVAAGAEPRMTGSGPTLFVLDDDPGRADRLAARIGRAGIRTTRTRLRHEPASIERVEDDGESEEEPA